MRAVWILLAVISAETLALPMATSRTEYLKQILSEPHNPRINTIIEELILGLVEDLRTIMLHGNDDIPVLDPLEINHVAVDDQIIPLPGSQVTLEDMVVRNLATFAVNELTVTLTSLLLQRYRIIFDGDIPIIDVNVGHYDMSVNAMGANVFGKGDAVIYVVKPRIQFNILIAPRISISGIFMNLLECDIKFSLGDFQPHITGMFNDDALSEFVSLFLQNLVRELLDFYENDINSFLSTTVFEVANDFLRDFDIGSILG